MRRTFNYVPSRTALRRGAMFLIALFVAVLLGSVWAVMWLANENETLDERDRQSLADRESLRHDLTAEQAAREALEQQIRGLGEKPVLEPEDVPPEADVIVVPGPRGDRGKSCIEEIGYPRCRGAAGREDQEPERQEAEIQDGESDDPEQQDAEIQDPEKDDPDPDDPEKDDPDPASPYNFTFQFVVPGAGGSPDQTYTVTCNSGTGSCSVS